MNQILPQVGEREGYGAYRSVFLPFPGHHGQESRSGVDRRLRELEGEAPDALGQTPRAPVLLPVLLAVVEDRRRPAVGQADEVGLAVAGVVLPGGHRLSPSTVRPCFHSSA